MAENKKETPTLQKFAEILFRQSMGIEENPNNLSTPDVLGLVRQAAKDPAFMQDYLQKQVAVDPPVMDPTPPVMDPTPQSPPRIMDPMTDNAMFDRSPVTVQDPVPPVNPPMFQQEVQYAAPPVGFQPQVPVRNIPFQSTGESQRNAPFRFNFQPQTMPMLASEQILNPLMPVRQPLAYDFAPQIKELARRASKPDSREYRGIMQTLNQRQV
tara:strand:+ start:336 stop:971 length:636 start_codon:yes stop_codon:yes gene_type:complete